MALRQILHADADPSTICHSVYIPESKEDPCDGNSHKGWLEGEERTARGISAGMERIERKNKDRQG